MTSGSNEQLQQELEYTLLKLDCHNWWISKMQYGYLEERYAIKFCFKLGKTATETYGILQTVFQPSCMHQFWSGIRDSRKAWSLWGMMRGVGGVRKSIHHSWLAKGLGYSVEGLREGFPSEEANPYQIGSATFPSRQCPSQQLHPCHRLFDQDGNQDRSSFSL